MIKLIVVYRGRLPWLLLFLTGAVQGWAQHPDVKLLTEFEAAFSTAEGAWHGNIYHVPHQGGTLPIVVGPELTEGVIASLIELPCISMLEDREIWFPVLTRTVRHSLANPSPGSDFIVFPLCEAVMPEFLPNALFDPFDQMILLEVAFLYSHSIGEFRRRLSDLDWCKQAVATVRGRTLNE